MNEYCQVIYLPRTEGVSSTQLRSNKPVVIGTVGSDPSMTKLIKTAAAVDGVEMGKVFLDEEYFGNRKSFTTVYDSYDKMLDKVDAIYVATRPEKRYDFIKRAIEKGKHVISNSPMALSAEKYDELTATAHRNKTVLFDSIKTAYMLAFSRMILLVKGGLIGDVKSIDVTCTSLENYDWLVKTKYFSSFTDWGAIALLPIFKLLGLGYKKVSFSSLGDDNLDDIFTKVNMEYDGAIATISTGLGVKSEGDLRISGTKGYIYVPAPWWKSEYFEARFEDASNNKPYYYKSDNEGLSMELVHFARCIRSGDGNFYVESEISRAVADVMELYNEKK